MNLLTLNILVKSHIKIITTHRLWHTIRNRYRMFLPIITIIANVFQGSDLIVLWVSVIQSSPCASYVNATSQSFCMRTRTSILCKCVYAHFWYSVFGRFAQRGIRTRFCPAPWFPFCTDWYREKKNTLKLLIYFVSGFKISTKCVCWVPSKFPCQVRCSHCVK